MFQLNQKSWGISSCVIWCCDNQRINSFFLSLIAYWSKMSKNVYSLVRDEHLHGQFFFLFTNNISKNIVKENGYTELSNMSATGTHLCLLWKMFQLLWILVTPRGLMCRGAFNLNCFLLCINHQLLKAFFQQPWVHQDVFRFHTWLFFASCNCSLKRSTGSFICIASRIPPFSFICSILAFDRFSALFLFFKADFDKLTESNKWNKSG